MVIDSSRIIQSTHYTSIDMESLLPQGRHKKEGCEVGWLSSSEDGFPIEINISIKGIEVVAIWFAL